MVEQVVAPENKERERQMSGQPEIVDRDGRQHRVIDTTDTHQVLVDDFGHRIAVERSPGNKGGEQPLPGSGPGPVPNPESDQLRRRHEATRSQEQQDAEREEGLKGAEKNQPLEREAALKKMDRSALMREASKAGVKADGRWTDDRVRDEILAREAEARTKQDKK
jgi:hypothetical protein